MDASLCPASLLILIITVAVSLLGLYKNRRMLESFVMRPYDVVHGGRWFTLLTSGFVHSDIYHLFFNMLTFYFFAFSFEMVAGTARFLIIYFSALILSDLPSVFKHRDNPDFASLGASGAVSAIVFGSILYNPLAKMMILPVPIPIPAFIFGALYLAWCYYAGKKSFDNINHSAHFWGAVAGIVLTAVLDPYSVQSFIYTLF